jgi:hypothetical protein
MMPAVAVPGAPPSPRPAAIEVCLFYGTPRLTGDTSSKMARPSGLIGSPYHHFCDIRELTKFVNYTIR